MRYLKYRKSIIRGQWAIGVGMKCHRGIFSNGGGIFSNEGWSYLILDVIVLCMSYDYWVSHSDWCKFWAGPNIYFLGPDCWLDSNIEWTPASFVWLKLASGLSSSWEKRGPGINCMRMCSFQWIARTCYTTSKLSVMYTISLSLLWKILTRLKYALAALGTSHSLSKEKQWFSVQAVDYVVWLVCFSPLLYLPIWQSMIWVS